MARREFIDGPNFSGRSKTLLGMLRSGELGKESFFIGPYAEAALSGLSSSVADEIALYRARHANGRQPFPAPDLSHPESRKPQTLSGGEQVLLALHCCSLSNYPTVAIDTALEQLDPANRSRAFAWLEKCGLNVLLIDNRVRHPEREARKAEAQPSRYACDWDALIAAIVPCAAAPISVEGLDFSYAKDKPIFSGASADLEPGVAHRLSGANGAGKTTFLKLLAGVLAPSAGRITLARTRYEPWRHGNRALALAMQNPDHQWCGATLAEDIARRRNALPVGADASLLREQRLGAIARALGVESMDQNLYELPLASRKRVSWLWPFAGAYPWVLLDEPTIGQDAATRQQLGYAIGALCEAGYGVLFVTHDDDFAQRVPHRVLQVADMAIRSL
jgi:ATPase subunit of ABC transporter with duplicated ATPase domains